MVIGYSSTSRASNGENIRLHDEVREMDSRSTRNSYAAWEREVALTITIRPSSQGSWECPKGILDAPRQTQ